MTEQGAWRRHTKSRLDHIVEVAFGANIDADVEVLRRGGSIGAHATDNATPEIPFWLIMFKNVRMFFLGSDDFPKEAQMPATQDLPTRFRRGWARFEIGERIAEIARAQFTLGLHRFHQILPWTEACSREKPLRVA